MADAMQFDLVSPERRLTSVAATSVQVPGAEGDMTIMVQHAPTITTLRPGIVRVEAEGGMQEYVVTGGFAEIGEGVTVLAERALPRQEITQEIMDSWVAEAAEAHRAARERAGNEGETQGMADDTAKLLADMVAAGGHIGLDSKQPNL